MSEMESPFPKILTGEEPGTIIARNDDKQFALIECIEPEAAVHWLAVPFEYDYSTEDLGRLNRDRFLDLVDFAIDETKKRVEEYPVLGNGFTIKFHVGSFETIPHAKLHILSSE